MTIGCVSHVNHVGEELSHRSLEIFSTEFHIAFVVETWLVGFTFQRAKKKRQVYGQNQATPKATQYNTK